MRRFLSTATILSLSAVVLATPIFANEAVRQAGAAKFIAAKQEVELNVLEGRIKEVRDFELVVEDLESKEYTVPLFGFQDLEEYQKLNVQAGEKITIKGRNLSKGNAIKLQRSDSEGESLIIKMGEADYGMAPSLDIRKISGDEVLSIDKEMVEGGKTMVREAAPIDYTEILDESKFEELRSTKVLLRDDLIIGERQGQLTQAMSVNEDTFLPHEITINGTTIQLSAMIEAKTAIKAIK